MAFIISSSLEIALCMMEKELLKLRMYRRFSDNRLKAIRMAFSLLKAVPFLANKMVIFCNKIPVAAF